MQTFLIAVLFVALLGSLLMWNRKDAWGPSPAGVMVTVLLIAMIVSLWLSNE